jgi:uncharacterized protein DUF6600
MKLPASSAFATGVFMPRVMLPHRKFICRVVFGSALLLVGFGSVAHAQVTQTQPAPAYIAVVEGTATLDRDGDQQVAVVNMPLIAGDRLRTDDGRVEIRFPDGTGMEVGARSEIEMITDTRVRVLAGEVDRLEAEPVTAQSSDYLPQGLQTYASTFDQYGAWQYSSPYGYVWYPRVAAAWRPYYYGYWDAVGPYGWTWIGSDVWAWPTHHYGRWGYARGAWFWIPGRTFAPAWVSWGTAVDYVSWCPLGFDNRPVFALSVGYGHGWNGWTVFPRSYFGARGHYVPRYAVAPYTISPRTTFVAHDTPPLPRRDRTFATRGRDAGVVSGIAVPRSSASEGRGAPRFERPANQDRRSNVDERTQRTDRGWTGVAVPRTVTPMPQPSNPAQRVLPVQPVQPMRPPQTLTPQVQPRHAPQVQPGYVPQVQPGYAQPRYTPQVQPRYTPPQRVTPVAPPPPQAAPPPHAAPQRSAPAGASSSGTATQRSGGGEGHGGHRR